MTELARLDDYLSSDDSPDRCLMLSDLDGFLHGIACSPVEIPVREWMPEALGGSVVDVPPWVLRDIAVLFSEILKGLLASEPGVEPLFWQRRDSHTIAMDWCEGFMQAVRLRPKEWLRLTESGTHGFLMTPILLHLLDENGDSILGVAKDDLDEAIDTAADAIPAVVLRIFRFWQEAQR